MPITTKYQIKAKANKEAEIWIYEQIGGGYYGDGLSAKKFKDDLKALGDITKITLRINSPGGDVFDGNAIYNILAQHKSTKDVYVDGIAASMASVIAMVGDRIYMADNALMMVHDPWTMAAGSADDLRKSAELMDKIKQSMITTYAKRTKLDEDKIGELMDAETWMDADEAIALGFADEIVDALDIAACADLSKFNFRNTPKLPSPKVAALGIKPKAGIVVVSNLPGVSGQTLKGKTMKTLAEQIASFEATRQAKSARMTEIMNLSAESGQTLDDAQAQEYDTVQGEIKAIDNHLVRLHDQEKLAIAGATRIEAGAVNSTETGVQARSGIVTVKGPNLPKGTAFTRYAMALMGSMVDKHRRSPLQIAHAQAHWRDTTPEVEKVLAVAVDAGDTTTNHWASELADYTYMASEFIEFLRPQTILGKIPGLRMVPFNIKMPKQTAGSSVGWVGEGNPKPVSKLAFDTATLRFAKAAGIVVLTDELVRFSNPAAETLVRTDMAGTITEFLDGQFTNPSVAVNGDVSPASITNGAGHDSASGTSAEDFRADFAQALNVMIAANIDPSGLVFVMKPTLAVQLSLMRNLLGTKEFPDINANGGTLEGYPVVTSNSAPASTWILVKPSEILLADDGGIQIDASREATILMDNGVSPATTTTVSLFQNNMVALRVERVINWARRRLQAVYYITGANYGGGSPS